MLKKQVRAKYTPEFKHEAVRMAEAKGSIAEVARQLLRMEGFTPEIVARITNLGIDEVQRLGAEGQGA